MPATARDTAWTGPARVALVAIGGSAGSLDVVGQVLERLPPTWPLPLVVVVHQPRTGRGLLAEVLAQRCRLPVREAEDKLPAEPGVVYVGVPGYHLLVDDGPTLALSVDEPVHFSIPSIDVLFESAAAALGRRVAGVLLSGANEDGAAGLRAIHAAGGIAAVQRPEEAVSRVMPDAGLRLCPDAEVIGAAGLAAFLGTLVPGADGEARA